MRWSGYRIYPYLYRCLKPLFPHCLWSGSLQEKAIAISYDDGPHPQYTLELLNVLDRYGIRANFFWLGERVKAFPDVAKMVCDRGHWIGLHGYRHVNFPQLTPQQLYHSLQQTQQVIIDACQLEHPQGLARLRDVRPPNGIFLPRTLELLREWNYRPVMWSVVPEDWLSPGVAKVCDRTLQQVTNGSLIVLHDGVYGGESVAEASDRIISVLLQQGYHFVSVDRFWQYRDR
ncbi:polysaccharide deacetylase family protein [Roseofilum casamattae]|uniref:Polysaccharide deacetylase family protein n=1 Tax=Roseofilum casamattae BLCC-M143 TaxID=3022442 RepID=A0ABT7BWX3_9CYAN|nr:polysaccharide deacetylase family protein [Roseofilum casamattae]MDJ1183575.1 polysaccharide deacetylase family protein [Roseofilum casamattae BLCC-M143]